MGKRRIEYEVQHHVVFVEYHPDIFEMWFYTACRGILPILLDEAAQQAEQLEAMKQTQGKLVLFTQTIDDTGKPLMTLKVMNGH